MSHRRTAEEGEPAALQWRENWTKGDSYSFEDPERFCLGVCDGDPHTHWACDSSVDPCGESDRGWRVSKRAQKAGVGTFLRHIAIPCVCMRWSEREARWVVLETDSTASVPVSAPVRDRPRETVRVSMSEAQAARETEAVDAPAGACAIVCAFVCVREGASGCAEEGATDREGCSASVCA